jgi:hypothetical protein
MFSANSPHAAEGRSPPHPRCSDAKKHLQIGPCSYSSCLGVDSAFLMSSAGVQKPFEVGRSTRTVSADTDAPRLEARPADTTGSLQSQSYWQGQEQ